MIPLSAPDIGPAEIAAVTDVLVSRRLSLGPRVPALEAALAATTGVRHAVAVNSGTSALHLAVRALGLRDGDEVVTTPFTFVATANCLLYERARPVFVDIDPGTRNIDPGRVEAAITPRTRAILPVHVFGLPCDMDALGEIARRHGLRLLEDACEAIGARWRDRPAGSYGAAATLSFYPNKQITTAEGGAVLTDDAGVADDCRRMRNHGRLAGGALDHDRLGYNYRLSELHAALGLAQLGRLTEILASRARVAAWYADCLRDVPGLRLPPEVPEASMSWFVYVVELDDPLLAHRRDAIARALEARGIATGVYFPPVHLQPLYRSTFGHRPGDFPVTERVSARALALPFFTQLQREQVEEVAAGLRHVLADERRGSGQKAGAR
jgi:perosamine synthetase